MQTVEVSHVAKAFGNVQAVADVSFEVQKGEIFGLLGPNGAGKTTTIRLMLDIFRPDRGTVSILSGPMSEAKKDRIGYMPEERGLYQEITLERCLIHLATLKGVSQGEARSRLDQQLRRWDLWAHRTKKVKELSKGMQQKAQIINTILHRPELVIVDEPFAALDPVNTQLVKDLMRELRDEGVTIIMSTHQMHQVEELCDRILLIDDGENVLYGELDEIRRQYASRAVMVRAAGDLAADWEQEIWRVAGVAEVLPHNTAVKLVLTEDSTPQQVLSALVARDILLERFEIAVPTLDEIFIRVVEERDGREGER
jgi:ABC-2 type transport system ATP-binding protein